MTRRASTLLLLVLTLGSLTITVPGTARAAAGPVHTLEVSGEGVASYPAFDAAVQRYAVTTTSATAGTVTVTATTDDPAGTVLIDGVPDADGARTLTGLMEGDEISVWFVDAGGTERHSLVYLPADFPTLERVTPDPAPDTLEPGDVLLTLFNLQPDTSTYETALDVNGVPAFVQSQPQAMDLKPILGGGYSVSRNSSTGNGQALFELDDQFREVRSLRTSGLVNTDGHDSIVAPDGSVWLMSYEPDPDTGLTDARVQQIRPGGSVGFTWSSAAFAAQTMVGPGAPGGIDPDDYAHLNSMQLMADGDLLLSFRHLSAAFKIATRDHDGFTEGQVVWQLGGRDSDFSFAAGDTGPCAQHTVYELADGNILMFDNGSTTSTGSLCVDQSDPQGPGVGRPQTRAVEYALDTVNGTAGIVWQYAPPGVHTIFAGSAQRLPGGDTMIGWAASTAAMATEVDPTGAKVWELRDTEPDPQKRYFTYRAHKVVVPDATRPTVTLAGLANGASLVQDAVLTPSYSCTDRGGSSLQTCSASRASVDTRLPGPHTWSVTATDGAGNTTTVTRTYTVRASVRPDAQVRITGTPTWRGNQTYGAPDTQRVARALKRPGGIAVVRVRMQNDGARADRFTYRVNGRSPAFRVLSSHLAGGTTPLLQPGQSWVLEIRVVRRDRARPGDRVVVRVPIRSTTRPGLYDGVSAQVTARR